MAGVIAVLLLRVLAFPAVAGVALPRPAGYVTDTANVLGPEARRTLEAIAAEVEQKSGAEIAVVTVASLDGETVETYAVELFKAWGIGKKGKDNGVLLLVAPQDRKLRIEVGYGLEGVLPDGKCGEIRDRCLVPAFKRGDFSAGVLCAVAEMAGVILGTEADSARHVVRPLRSVKPETEKLLFEVFMILVFFYFVLRIELGKPILRDYLALLLGGFLGGGRFRGGGFGGGGFGGGGFGGFGGGGSGGGGSSGSW